MSVILSFLAGALVSEVPDVAAHGGSVSGTPELLLRLMMLIVVGGILYNLWGTIAVFGGKIGQALKMMALGILLFSLEAVDQILALFNLDYASALFGSGGMALFHDVHKLLGLIFLAWGLSRLSKIYSSDK